MKLPELRRIKQFRRFSDFSETALITCAGLYEPLLIDAGNIRTYYTETPDHHKVNFYDEVSEDVKAFHRYLKARDIIDLPCFVCKRNQPYGTVGWFNPREANEHENEEKQFQGTDRIPIANMMLGLDNAEERRNRPLKERVDYRFGEDRFIVLSRNVFDDRTRSRFIETEEQEYRQILAQNCIYRILLVASDVRKDYRCAMDPTHRCFIEFVLKQAVPEKPDEMIEYEKRLEDDRNAKMSIEEQEAVDLYKELRFCIIAKKVSQYPSMADIQLLDTERYRSVLGKRYDDYRRALGLYSSEIGAGALVYLRRVFEFVVEDVHKECQKESGWNEDKYNKLLKFNERIKYLEGFGKTIVPPELQPVKTKLYGALSKGVHELEEDECKAIFPDLKDAIDLLLDAKIAAQKKAKKVKQINQRIQNMKT